MPASSLESVNPRGSFAHPGSRRAVSSAGRAHRTSRADSSITAPVVGEPVGRPFRDSGRGDSGRRSEEHTSELQSHSDLVCRLLLEKKKIITSMSRSVVDNSYDQ